jgi:hypothetical protein
MLLVTRLTGFFYSVYLLYWYKVQIPTQKELQGVGIREWRHLHKKHQFTISSKYLLSE